LLLEHCKNNPELHPPRVRKSCEVARVDPVLPSVLISGVCLHWLSRNCPFHQGFITSFRSATLILFFPSSTSSISQSVNHQLFRQHWLAASLYAIKLDIHLYFFARGFELSSPVPSFLYIACNGRSRTSTPLASCDDGCQCSTTDRESVPCHHLPQLEIFFRGIAVLPSNGVGKPYRY
jgi:hypothetical protein